MCNNWIVMHRLKKAKKKNCLISEKASNTLHDRHDITSVKKLSHIWKTLRAKKGEEEVRVHSSDIRPAIQQWR
jgi:hypothetical protein